MFTVSTITYGPSQIRVAQDLDTNQWYLYTFNADTGQVTGDRSDPRPGTLDRVASMTESGVRWVSRARSGQAMVAHLRKRAEEDPVWADMADHVAESIKADEEG